MGSEIEIETFISLLASKVYVTISYKLQFVFVGKLPICYRFWGGEKSIYNFCFRKIASARQYFYPYRTLWLLNKAVEL